MKSQPALRVKSYFAHSVDAAIAQARQELGMEALLLNTRKLPREDGQPAGYEVVFGLAGAGAQGPARVQLPSRELRGLSTESRPESRHESGHEGRATLQESRVQLQEF